MCVCTQHSSYLHIVAVSGKVITDIVPARNGLLFLKKGREGLKQTAASGGWLNLTLALGKDLRGGAAPVAPGMADDRASGVAMSSESFL